MTYNIHTTTRSIAMGKLGARTDQKPKISKGYLTSLYFYIRIPFIYKFPIKLHVFYSVGSIFAPNV